MDDPAFEVFNYQKIVSTPIRSQDERSISGGVGIVLTFQSTDQRDVDPLYKRGTKEGLGKGLDKGLEEGLDMPSIETDSVL